MKLHLAPALFLLIATCHPAAASGAQPAPANTRPELPKNYRANAAVQLARDYASDAIGPAEIFPEPIKSAGNFFAGEQVYVRYPVRRTNFLGAESTAMRCIFIGTYQHVVTGRTSGPSISRPRTDSDECQPKEKFVRFTELEQMGAKLRKCKEKGEERCLLATNIPEREAKKLINRR